VCVKSLKRGQGIYMIQKEVRLDMIFTSLYHGSFTSMFMKDPPTAVSMERAKRELSIDICGYVGPPKSSENTISSLFTLPLIYL